MRLLDFPLLTDENLPPPVVAHVRELGLDVTDVRENGLNGEDDSTLLVRATTEGRAVLTFDGDFGTLTVHEAQPFVGIIRLRPGHLSISETIALLQHLFSENPEVEVPFVIVARQTSTGVKIRVRQVLP